MEYKYILDYKAISTRVKVARKIAGLTQAELAEKIGISTNAVAKLETNLMTTSLQTLIGVSNVLNVDINYFLVSENSAEKRQTNIDMFLDSLIEKLSQRDKELIIHIVNGLKSYNSSDGE